MRQIDSKDREIGVASPPYELYKGMDEAVAPWIVNLAKSNLWIHELKEQPPAAIYRVGSRTKGGEPRGDSDFDYLLLYDMDVHCPFFHEFWIHELHNNLYIDVVHFSRKDLQHPEGMNNFPERLLLLRKYSRRRELVYGTDIVHKWWSPKIFDLFEKYGVTDEVERKVNFGMMSVSDLGIPDGPCDTAAPSKEGKRTITRR